MKKVSVSLSALSLTLLRFKCPLVPRIAGEGTYLFRSLPCDAGERTYLFRSLHRDAGERIELFNSLPCDAGEKGTLEAQQGRGEGTYA